MNRTSQELVDSYYDRLLAENELKALGSGLLQSKDLQREFAEATRDEVALYKIHNSGSMASGVDCTTENISASSSSRMKWFAMAAALAVVVGVGVLWSLLREQPAGVVRGCTGNVTLRESEGNVPVTIGKVLPMYASLDLSDGAMVDIALDGGGSLRLEGESEVRALSPLDSINRAKQGWLTQESPSLPQLRLAAGASARVQYPNESTLLDVWEKTRLYLDCSGGCKRISIADGGFTCEASPQTMPMLVQTERALMTVVGTKFSAGQLEDGDVFEVEHGTVSVTRQKDKKRIDVTGGQFAVVSARGAFAALQSPETQGEIGMKNHLARMVLLMSFAARAAGANIIPNPDFEEGQDSALTGWYEGGRQAIPRIPDSVESQRNVSIAWDTLSSGNGQGSLKMVADTSRGDDAFGIVTTGNLPVCGGYDYLFNFRYRSEGLRIHDSNFKGGCRLVADLFFHKYKDGTQERGKYIGNHRLITHTDSRGWSEVSIDGGQKLQFTAPDGADCVQVRLQLNNAVANTVATVNVDDVKLEPADPTLPNTGFELGAAEEPKAWKKVGSGQMAWDDSVVHKGKRSVSVSNAGDGPLSGWSTVIPVRPDRKYCFGGFIKGGDLNADGFVPGGVFGIQFLDAHMQPVGDPVYSEAVGTNQDWTEKKTALSRTPAGAMFARLTAGLSYCRGTAWFDDVYLVLEEVEPENVQYLFRKPTASADVTYAINLLQNGDVEAGSGKTPDGWEYIGKSAPDWAEAEEQKFHTNGRPDFTVGRGQGQWSRTQVYAGTGALLNISIDPPLARHNQWFGRNPVDGYWLSAPMPCEEGNGYLAAGWIRPGAKIISAWYGPFELKFYDKAGRELRQASAPRSALGSAEANEWSYWFTLPWVAPKNAVTMRLRFGQELSAKDGGWGRTLADNLAVWESPVAVKQEEASQLTAKTELSRRWFEQSHEKIAPPYMPSPEKMAAYETCWGHVQEYGPQTLFSQTAKPVQLTYSVMNMLGEARKLSLEIFRTDWRGENPVTIKTDPFNVDGYRMASCKVTLPASGAYGAYHLDVKVIEQDAGVGSFSGRYAVLPELKRPHTAENIWGVTIYNGSVTGEDTPRQNALGKMLETAGFGISWVRMHFDIDKPDVLKEKIAEMQNVIDWYNARGIRPVLQLNPKFDPRPHNYSLATESAKMIAEAFVGKLAAYGNWGIEQVNSASPYRGGGEARITDDEYDHLLLALYEGVKSVDAQTPVLVGNIATDFDGRTIKRLYRDPVKGAFDGAIINAYMGPKRCINSLIQEFEKHGDTKKAVWYEESCSQRSPFIGEARRYGESTGAESQVRTWLELAGTYGKRLKAMTMWGFIDNSAQDIMMVTPDMQPRPQYVAHAVMSDTLADAELVGNHSVGALGIFEWKRTDGPVFACWATAGESVVSFEAPTGTLQVMDIMGNVTYRKAADGVVPVRLNDSPVYIASSGDVRISKRLELLIAHATTLVNDPKIHVTIKNNSDKPMPVRMKITGPVSEDAPESATVPAKGQTEFDVVVSGASDDTMRYMFRVECTTNAGAVFAASRELNFATAVKAAIAPALDGSWSGWEKARPVLFGQDGGGIQPQIRGEVYEGANDIVGTFRLMWDDSCLYFGLETTDDVFLSQPERGSAGFMGDSVEFAVQPDNIRENDATYYEYEIYRPMNEKMYAASRRFPLPTGVVDNWKATVQLTGKRGGAVYQIAIPWKDLGVGVPSAGKVMSMAIVLNDHDNPKAPMGGGRSRVKWFDGIDGAKSPVEFGDVVLTEP